MKLLLVSAFGLLGILIRYFSDTNFSLYKFPVHTLIVNLVGCFLIGIFYNLKGINPDLRIALTIGLCGGLTTFSSYSFQTIDMIQNGEIMPAMFYLVLSPILGLLMVATSMKIFS